MQIFKPGQYLKLPLRGTIDFTFTAHQALAPEDNVSDVTDRDRVAF